MSYHVLQLLKLIHLLRLELSRDTIQDVDDVVFCVSSLVSRTFVVNHVEHLVLDKLVDKLSELSLLGDEAQVYVVIVASHNKI